MERKKTILNIELPGSPFLVAEGLLELAKSFPIDMQGTWSINKVQAYGNSLGGYRCSILATRPDN